VSHYKSQTHMSPTFNTYLTTKYPSFFFFFFLMIRRPPRSTLFPSPTLFRSRAARRSASSAPRPRRSSSPPLARRAGDRKSTRLNSSHTVISYALFCLQKKYHHNPPAELGPTPSLSAHPIPSPSLQ